MFDNLQNNSFSRHIPFEWTFLILAVSFKNHWGAIAQFIERLLIIEIVYYYCENLLILILYKEIYDCKTDF